VRSGARAAFDVLAASLAIAVWLLVVVPVSWARRLARRRSGRRPTILWGPIPIPNIVYSAKAERQLGYRSRTLVYDVYRISARSDFDHVLDLRRFPGLGVLAPYAAFIWAGLTTDVFGFSFEGGLLWATRWWRVELVLLGLARKRIVVYPYGSDARLASRTRALGRWNAYTDIPPGDEDRSEADVRARLAAFGRHADVVLGCADLVEDLPRLDGIFLYPFDASGWVPVEEEDDGVVTVVHAPNHRQYKGTRYLIEAVDRLRAAGVPVELELVEGRRLDDARSVYERADVIADQFLIGAYALFAIEGMALGKPVICYLNDRFRPRHPEWAECPIVSANPDELEDAIRNLVSDPELRRELGARGPAYVREYHSLESVGAAMDAVYRGLD
jgi:glycosyltransferase involved in cell wall biosynthesis